MRQYKITLIGSDFTRPVFLEYPADMVIKDSFCVAAAKQKIFTLFAFSKTLII